jgi:hypothetical protein
MKRVCLACWCLFGCGPAVGTDDGGADASESAGSSGGSTSSETSPATAPTTQTVTSAGTTASTSPVTTATASTTGETTTATAGSTTGSVELECIDASDCWLFSTCCDCEALHVEARGVDSCPEVDCAGDWCSFNGVEQVECRYGRCAVVGASCNPNGVVCAQAPPDCEPGFVPGTADGCWTGTCVAAELCDYVPACDACPDDTVCVSWVPGPKAPTLYSCEPIPAACGGVATCECAADLCTGWGDCFDDGENRISCVGV